MQKPILVLGARGQVAIALQRLAKVRGISLVAAGRPDLDVKDIGSIAAGINSVGPGIVINAAAYTAVDKAQGEGQEEAYTINAEAPARLAVLCKANQIPLIHISTDYVFDGLKGAPYLEDDEMVPLNNYGASKAAGEMAVRAAGPEHIILRTQWVYSPNGGNFVKTMLRVGQERDEISVVNDQIGSPTSADEIAAALLDVAATVEGGAPADLWGTYHFSGIGMTTWHGFAAEIFRLAGEAGMKTPKLKAISTLEYPTPAVRPLAAVLATDKIQQAFGITPASWEETLARIFPTIVESVKVEATA